MRWWAAIIVAAVALTACIDASSAGRDVSADSGSPGNVALFCRAWPDAREKLLGIVSRETTPEYQDQELAVARFLGDVDSTVPTEVRTEWNRAYWTYQQISDILFLTGYSEGTIRAVHLEMAFGDAGSEAAVADTEAAVAAIDEWAVTACGDFCSRWPELGRILQIPVVANPEELRRTIDQHEAALTAGERLVPDEIARYWNIAAGYQSAYLDLARSLDFDKRSLGEGEAGAEGFTEVVGLPFDEVQQAVDEAKEEISSWVEANCEAATATVGASGSPGSLAIRILPHQYLTNRTVFMALLPPGTDFASVRSGDSYVAASCTEVESHDEWERGLTEAAPQAAEVGMEPEEFLLDQFGDEHFSHALVSIAAAAEVYEQPDICVHTSEGEAALVPGGAYELFVGAYYGAPGNYYNYFASPEHCLQFPVTIDGDTVVDPPDLEPCTLEPLGSPEEIARRTSAPSETGGTLQVLVDSALQSEEYDFCRLEGVLLPAGTTLNAVGRGDAWPSGMFWFHRLSPRNVEGPDERWARSPGLVPIMAVPPSGGGEVPIHPEILPDGPWDTRFADPIPLAVGSYDLRIEETCEDEDAQEDDDIRRRCAFVAVEVDGATLVEMPELGACP